MAGPNSLPQTQQPQNDGIILRNHEFLKSLEYLLIAPAWKDKTYNSKWTVTGTPGQAAGQRGMSLVVSPSNYITMPSVAGTGSWTIAAIIRPADASANSVYAGMCESPGSGTRDRSIQTTAGGNWSGYIFDTTISNTVFADSGVAPSTSRTDIVVVTCDASGLKLYCNVNGTENSGQAIGNAGFNGYASPEFCLGNPTDVTSTRPIGSNIALLIRTNAYWNAKTRREFIRNPWAFIRSVEDIRPASVNGIQFDAAGNSGDVAAASSYSGSASWSGTNRMLSVDVSMLGAGVTVTAMTYGGAACTKIGSISTVTSFGSVEQWRICSSDSGAPGAGSNTLSITLSGSLEFAAEWASYTGVNQTLPVEGFNSAQATNVGAADATVSITSVADNCWIHSAVVASDTSITANQTSRNNISGTLGSGANEDNNAAVTPPGATTMSYTGVGALATWAIAGYAIRPIAAAGGVVGQFFMGVIAVIRAAFR